MSIFPKTSWITTICCNCGIYFLHMLKKWCNNKNPLLFVMDPRIMSKSLTEKQNDLGLCVPVKETSASLSMPSSWVLSLSDLELPRDLFMFLKYWPHLCLPASFFSLFSFALLFWNQTCAETWVSFHSIPTGPYKHPNTTVKGWPEP